MQGDVELAAQGLRKVIAEAERVGAAWPLIPARTALADLLLVRGSGVAGQAEASAALALAQGKGLPAWGREVTRLASRSDGVVGQAALMT